MIELTAIVTGNVQGVAYRAYIQEAATELRLVGWTKNNADGSVIVCAQGMPDILKDFVEHLHEGSLLAKVDSVSVEWSSPKRTYDEFSVLH